MSDTPINLNKARKARAKADKAEAADANRVLHGLSKAEKAKARAQAERRAAKLDAHKRET